MRAELLNKYHSVCKMQTHTFYSVLGHVVPPKNTPVYMYAASKAANVTLTEGLRRELLQMNSKIRLTVSSTPCACVMVKNFSSVSEYFHMMSH
jgi:short-subunit dehydrogenase